VKLKNISDEINVYSLEVAAAPGENAKASPWSLTKPLAKSSIAVLPFANMTGDREQDHFIDGVVEDIITALSRFPDVSVIARNMTFIYKGQAVDIRKVATDLGVKYVLEGSARKSGNRIRITGQLIEAANGTTFGQTVSMEISTTGSTFRTRSWVQSLAHRTNAAQCGDRTCEPQA